MLLAHGETLVRIVPGQAQDPYSQGERPDWDHPGETTIRGCAVYPTRAVENPGVGRDQAIETLTVLLPPGTVIDYQDRLRIRGIVYEVTGAAHDYHHPMTGWTPGVEVQVTRWEG